MRYDFRNPLWKKRPAAALQACSQELENKLADLVVQRDLHMDVYAEMLLLEEILGIKHKVTVEK
jgi:hypothetical protein